MRGWTLRRKHMLYVILKNGKRDDLPVWAVAPFDTVQMAIEAVQGLESNLNRLKDHSPYTISTLAAIYPELYPNLISLCK